MSVRVDMWVISVYFHFFDLRHVVSPGLLGEHGSACHGSVLQGQFEGTIHTENGTYHIEPMERYTSTHTDHHSIIYHEDDMGEQPLDL